MKNNGPLVSIIVTTKDSEAFLEQCLASVKKQTYRNSELLIIDNYSSDRTLAIARKYTEKIFTYGPERSAQRNFGARKAAGEYVYMVDADFELDSRVVEQCVGKIQGGYDAIVVHNSPDITVSWIAKIRKFEVDMYKYNLDHSAARFFRKSVFLSIGGYTESITAGEDYDIQNKLNKVNYKTGFINAEALHLGEPTSFWRHMMKYYWYGKDFVTFVHSNKAESKTQLSPIRTVYKAHWKDFLRHPILGSGFIFYTITKFSFGATGYVAGKLTKK